jgi:GNAT superfamily N-acetyltransferase
MHVIRRATAEDAKTIASQRVKMFQDNDVEPVCTWELLESESEQWTLAKLASGDYVGWIVESASWEDELSVIGGAGVWFMDWPPHWMHQEPTRGYLLNFYVVPHARGKGIAKELVRLAVAECASRGVHVATLHASKMGRPVYEALGWGPSNEMMLR